MRRRLGTALAAAAMVVTVAGCGGGGSEDSSQEEATEQASEAPAPETGDRPSVADLAAALERDGEGITAEQAECAAQVLVDSDFSDATLASLAAGDETIEGMASEEDLRALDTAGPKIVECYGLGG
ncbi:hypothetical protein [Nocardioides marmoraquaticus]